VSVTEELEGAATSSLKRAERLSSINPSLGLFGSELLARDPKRKNLSKLPLFLRVELSEHDSANLEVISWCSGSSCGSSQQIDAFTRVKNLIFWGNKIEKQVQFPELAP